MKVVTEKRPPGRPSEIDGRAVNVWLDEESIERARQLGNGQISAGIRKALAKHVRMGLSNRS